MGLHATLSGVVTIVPPASTAVATAARLEPRDRASKAAHSLAPAPSCVIPCQMDTCDTCGNEYDKAFSVTIGGSSYTFDSFECAISKLAPRCDNCDCRIVGHGVEDAGVYFCSAHCARQAGQFGLTDRK